MFCKICEHNIRNVFNISSFLEEKNVLFSIIRTRRQEYIIRLREIALQREEIIMQIRKFRVLLLSICKSFDT